MLCFVRSLAVLLAVSLVSLPSVSFSIDYPSMTTEELSALRGTLSSAAVEERDAFRVEWLKRVAEMSSAEKEKYLASGPGQGAGNRNATGLGNGSGRGKGGGNSNGNGKGRQ